MREVVLTPRRALVAGILGGIAAVALRRPAAGQTPAEPSVRLFRIVGPRDSVTIGIGAAELAGWGAGEPVTVVAERLLAEGRITAWAYAVGRAADGSLALQPRGRIAILRNDALRIEPHVAAHPVVAPAS
jgi:hypothetical protein